MKKILLMLLTFVMAFMPAMSFANDNMEDLIEVSYDKDSISAIGFSPDQVTVYTQNAYVEDTLISYNPLEVYSGYWIYGRNYTHYDEFFLPNDQLTVVFKDGSSKVFTARYVDGDVTDDNFRPEYIRFCNGNEMLDWNPYIDGVKLELGDNEKTLVWKGVSTKINVFLSDEIIDDSSSEHTHSLIHIAAKSATCTTAGNNEYWKCSDCDKIFSDADGTNEINISDTVIPGGHRFDSWITTKKATELAAGQQSRKCSLCDKTETETIVKLAPTLPAVKIIAPKTAKKAATIKWKKVSKNNLKKIKKIEIQYSTDKNFEKNVISKIVKAKKTSYKLKKLKAKKKYYVRIRAYTKEDGEVHVSKWSAKKSFKAK